MGALLSYFGYGRKDETPIKGFQERIFNVFRYSHRGIIGSIPIVIFVVLCMTPAGDLKEKPERTTLLIWILMFMLLLLHPLRVSGISLIPCFLLPVLHVKDSATVCNNYSSPPLILMVTGGYLRTLLNCSGVDKRFAMWMLFPKTDSKITNERMVIKVSLAAYILSMVSDKLHVVPFIMKQVCGPLLELQDRPGPESPQIEQVGEIIKRHTSSSGQTYAEKKKKNRNQSDSKGGGDTNFEKMRYVMANAIVSSSTIGSLAFINGAYNMMFMKILWDTHLQPDTFNFLDYSVFAIPVSLILFLVNLIYLWAAMKYSGGKQMSDPAMTAFRTSCLKGRSEIKKKMTMHEKLTIIFSILVHVAYFTRWSYLIKIFVGKMGWADRKKFVLPTKSSTIPDATVSAGFVIITSCLPATFNFLKLLTAKKRSDLPPAKQDSPILFWKFADKSCNYGYMFLAGSFSVLNMAIRTSDFPKLYLWPYFKFITDKAPFVVVFILCFGTSVLSNIMTSVGAAGMTCMLALNIIEPLRGELWKRRHLLVLACGFGASFGYAPRFMYTPSYSSRVVAELNLLKQVKFAIPSVLICAVVSSVAIALYGPLVLHVT